MSISLALARRMKRFVLAAVLLLVSAIVATGCANVTLSGGSGQPPAPPPGPPATPTGIGSVTITPNVAAIAAGQTVQFTATASNGGAIQWSVSGGGSIDQKGNYTAPGSISRSENVTVTAALVSNPTQDYATAVVSVINPGAIACPDTTGNPQVAQYTVYLPMQGTVSVEFGTSTNYGLNTWVLPTPSPNGGQVQLWVAGMLGNTSYHMRGVATLEDGAVFHDVDQVCTTGTPPFTTPVQASGSGTPQPGIEMWNSVVYNGKMLTGNAAQAFATDLQGNVLWTYTYQHSQADLIQGVDLLPDGDLLMTISYLSSLNTPSGSNVVNEVREVDLAGNTVRSITVDALNKKLSSAKNLVDAEGQTYSVNSFHHDVLALPNGHWVLLADYVRGYSNLPGQGANTPVRGDAIIDIDQNGNPDWVWNTFDALANVCAPAGVCGVNRHPMNFPDWTHSNHMLYSSDDHNLLLSMRHQNWIIKINFQDGTGSGAIMWKLGYQGDFKLEGGVDPTDWFYAQHGMNYTTSNTTGVFGLVLMDNGNDRYFPTGQVQCNPFNGPLPPTCYSTMPVLQINENTMTATIVKHYEPGPGQFSYFGGNAELLANGDYEVTFAAPKNGGIVQELDPQSLTVQWQGVTAGADQYHVNRLPSLYPGVQW